MYTYQLSKIQEVNTLAAVGGITPKLGNLVHKGENQLPCGSCPSSATGNPTLMRPVLSLGGTDYHLQGDRSLGSRAALTGKQFRRASWWETQLTQEELRDPPALTRF